jgi:hypothetical protein
LDAKANDKETFPCLMKKKILINFMEKSITQILWLIYINLINLEETQVFKILLELELYVTKITSETREISVGSRGVLLTKY